jgi:hypothetical protein
MKRKHAKIVVICFAKRSEYYANGLHLTSISPVSGKKLSEKETPDRKPVALNLKINIIHQKRHL